MNKNIEVTFKKIKRHLNKIIRFDAVKYANKHNITVEKAKSLLDNYKFNLKKLSNGERIDRNMFLRKLARLN